MYYRRIKELGKIYNLGYGLDLIDKDNKKHHVRYCIDGEYCIGDDSGEEK